MTDFFTASPAERRDILLSFRDRTDLDQWQLASLALADASWGDGWWLDPADLWAARAAAVKAFANQHKHAWIPANLPAVGLWVALQRADYANGAVDSTRVATLEGIPNWEWDQNTAWALNMAAFDQFVTREGHGHVPRTHREGTSSLGVWTMAVRHALTRKELPADFAADISGRPAWAERMRLGFDYNLSALHAFVAREGHARVPVAHVELLVNLGAWVNAQRSNRSAGILSDERIAKLEAVGGWAWHVRNRRSPEELAERRERKALKAAFAKTQDAENALF